MKEFGSGPFELDWVAIYKTGRVLLQAFLGALITFIIGWFTDHVDHQTFEQFGPYLAPILFTVFTASMEFFRTWLKDYRGKIPPQS
jgi:hypothetical protein